MHKGEIAKDGSNGDTIHKQVMNASRYHALEMHSGVHRPACASQATITETTTVNGGVWIDENKTEVRIVGALLRTKSPTIPRDGEDCNPFDITTKGRSAIQNGAGDHVASISSESSDMLTDNYPAFDSGCSTVITTNLLNTKNCEEVSINIMQAEDGVVMRATHKVRKTYYFHARNGRIHSMEFDALYVPNAKCDLIGGRSVTNSMLTASSSMQMIRSAVFIPKRTAKLLASNTRFPLLVMTSDCSGLRPLIWSPKNLLPRTATNYGTRDFVMWSST
jgi:hypothetical protein